MTSKKTDQPKAENKEKNKGGRPTSYTEETASIICERLADGESLRSICEDDEMPSRVTVFSWLSKNKEFLNQYTRAREAQADAIFDDILEIADDGRNDWMEKKDENEENIGWRENGEAMRRSALRIDARKWMAGKLSPKKYSDKYSLELSGSVDVKRSVADMTDEELAAIATASSK